MRRAHDDQADVNVQCKGGVANILGGAAVVAASGTSLAAAAQDSVGVAPLSPASEAVTPFELRIAPQEIAVLRRRLGLTRWPDAETVVDWSQGAPLARVRALVEYWRDGYDFTRLARALNALPQFRTEIDGLGIHFLHVRSRHEDALPLVLTHGWPGSVVEFIDVVAPLTDPTAHGGSVDDAFHLVIPSLPGYGFSDRPAEAGWDLPRIARAWGVLMKRLGYTRWVAQGGDWGAGVATWIAKQHVEGAAGIHLNLPVLFPPPLAGTPSVEEQASIDQLSTFEAQLSGYAKLQSTRPQTIGYALSDSPAGQAAWIYEKFAEWSDSQRDPERVLSRDRMLDNIMLYWITNTGASSARLYAESFGSDLSTQHVDLPVAVSVFPGELYRPLRVWGERVYSRLIYWNELDRGGHFAAFEQPGLFVDELRRSLRLLR